MNIKRNKEDTEKNKRSLKGKEIISDGFYLIATSFLTGVIMLFVTGIIFLNLD